MGSTSIMVFIITILYCSMVHMFILSDQNRYIYIYIYHRTSLHCAIIFRLVMMVTIAGHGILTLKVRMMLD